MFARLRSLSSRLGLTRWKRAALGLCGALLGPMAAILLMMPPQEDDADNPLESLMMGPMLPNIEEFKERFGVKRVCSGYGMTEIGFPLTTGWDPPNPRTCGKRREGGHGPG